MCIRDRCHPSEQRPVGVYMTVNDQDKFDIVSIAKKFGDLGCAMYATKGTAKVISELGLDVTVVDRLSATDSVIKLMDEGKIDYIVYTGKTDLESINDFIRLHHHAILLGITVLTALDTANALADIIASKFTEDNTELVDINHLRKEKLQLSFTKMQSCGNDYIYFDNRDGKITCPESIAINYVNIHYGIGGDGIVLIENSDVADAKMRIFNKDGTEGREMCIRDRDRRQYLRHERQTLERGRNRSAEQSTTCLQSVLYAAPGGTCTVSYTHLDVYKRQVSMYTVRRSFFLFRL